MSRTEATDQMEKAKGEQVSSQVQDTVQPNPHILLPKINVVGDVVKKSGTGLGPRQIGDYELLYFPDSTRSVYCVEDRAYTLSEPCFVVTRPGEQHTYAYDPIQPSRHLFIHFDFSDPSFKDHPPWPILQQGGPSYFPIEGDLLFGMMKQILYIAYAYPNRLQQRGSTLLLALLEEISGTVTEPSPAEQAIGIPPQITRALEYIEQHLSDPITVDGLAHAVGWTHEHFSRTFVRHIRRTPREMIIQRRIERACQLLLYSDESIKDVAFAVGFNDENYFSRVFKTVKGMTATQFRKKYFNHSYRDLYPVKKGDSLYPMNWIFVQP
ncbi:AraC family transcriptional regulator [Marinicrinis lubricantis]|uniref:Helix-turn-helix domain-containing protein n=1 Tax=Marinicrinis lubricantis TaxID=2086470 RepID=A0ABW1IJM2_9BACL